MSFRQFPAVDAHGENHVIIEFRPEPGAGPDKANAAPRYELEDGRHLLRHGTREFATADGQLQLRA